MAVAPLLILPAAEHLAAAVAVFSKRFFSSEKLDRKRTKKDDLQTTSWSEIIFFK
ncbi:hypothetical protein OM428_17255 [Enterococcus gallinarum]|nr:hypothetical protein [Enterococcus gallinarum]